MKTMRRSGNFLQRSFVATLAICIASVPLIRPAQAGYIVTLQQLGPDVVATGSGPIDLTGLS
ncbi:MAG TPA: hypothetical protein VLK27_00620 [Chthoniobacterales bacterium]|nr:hypothetical protein [Chthoniobacterales bacterium]